VRPPGAACVLLQVQVAWLRSPQPPPPPFAVLWPLRVAADRPTAALRLAGKCHRPHFLCVWSGRVKSVAAVAVVAPPSSGGGGEGGDDRLRSLSCPYARLCVYVFRRKTSPPPFPPQYPSSFPLRRIRKSRRAHCRRRRQEAPQTAVHCRRTPSAVTVATKTVLQMNARVVSGDRQEVAVVEVVGARSKVPGLVGRGGGGQLRRQELVRV
jgi:hypothetical protein